MRLVMLNAVAYAATLLDGRREARDVTVLVTLDLVDIAVLVRFIGAFVGHRQPQLVKLRVLNAANLRILRQFQRGELLFTRKIDAVKVFGIFEVELLDVVATVQVNDGDVARRVKLDGFKVAAARKVQVDEFVVAGLHCNDIGECLAQALRRRDAVQLDRRHRLGFVT